MKWMLFVSGAVLVAGAVGCSSASTTDTKDGPLSITPPGTFSISQDETKEFDVTVERPNTDDDVSVKIEKLPDGVKAKESSVKVKKGEKKAVFNLTADKEAKVQDGHESTVVGTYKGKDVSKTVKISVKKKS